MALFPVAAAIRRRHVHLRPDRYWLKCSTARARERRRFLGPEAFVFGDAEGNYVREFRTAWEATLAVAGITDLGWGLDGDLHWHDLRRECGPRLGERGVPLHEIQYFLGHANIVTTQRYLNVTLESLGRSVKVLETKAG